MFTKNKRKENTKIGLTRITDTIKVEESYSNFGKNNKKNTNEEVEQLGKMRKNKK